MSWIDIVLAMLVASLAAFGAQRRLSGLWIGLGAVLLLRPLLGLATAVPVVGLLLALIAGLLLGLLGRNVAPSLRQGVWWQKLAGAVGGTALGVALVLALVTSLPIQRSPSDPNAVRYLPREDLAPVLRGPVDRSWTVRLGGTILLHPLLDAQGDVPDDRAGLMGTLHRLLVAGEPWLREGG